MKRSKRWIAAYLTIVIAALSLIGSQVVKVDPFFHYHKPDTDSYYYELNSQRNQNDGIQKQFVYDAMITGTSMTENFKTSDMDQIFGTCSIKTSYSGGSFKEINDAVENALSHNPDLKIVVRGLDMGKFIEDKDAMRQDLGEYPSYLYDDNVFNDVKYIFNRSVLFGRVYPMLQKEGEKTGITSFDAYSNWMSTYSFGVNALDIKETEMNTDVKPVYLNDSERELIIGNITQNVTSLAKEYPDVTFYYFFPPYSILWWQELVSNGTIYKQLEAEKIVIETILPYENIKLYSFNDLTELTTDLNHYKDSIHYGSWINSLMLRYMKDEIGLLTKDNYEIYLETEKAFYATFDYASLGVQTDYESDYYAAALLNETIYGVTPLSVMEDSSINTVLNQAQFLVDDNQMATGVNCIGCLQREVKSEQSVAEYLVSSEYIGCKIVIEDISAYSYLEFWGKKNKDHGQPTVCIYDKNNNVIAQFSEKYSNLDEDWHQYVMDVSSLSGEVTIIFNGGYTDVTGSDDSSFSFKEITLY